MEEAGLAGKWSDTPLSHDDDDDTGDDNCMMMMMMVVVLECFCRDADVLAVVVARQGQARPPSPSGQPTNLFADGSVVWLL